MLTLFIGLISSVKAQLMQSSVVVDSFSNDFIQQSGEREVIKYYHSENDNEFILVRNHFNLNGSYSPNTIYQFDTFTVCRYTSEGIKKWERKYLFRNNGIINDIIETSDESIILAGSDGDDNIIYRLNQLGDTIRVTYSPRNSLSYYKDVVSDNNGNYYIITEMEINFGQSFCPSNPYFPLVIKKIVFTIEKRGIDDEILWQQELNNKIIHEYAFSSGSENLKYYLKNNPIDNTLQYIDYFTDSNSNNITVRLISFDQNGNISNQKDLYKYFEPSVCYKKPFLYLDNKRGYSVLHYSSDYSDITHLIYNHDGIKIDSFIQKPVDDPSFSYTDDSSIIISSEIFYSFNENNNTASRFNELSSGIFSTSYYYYFIQPYPDILIPIHKSDSDFFYKWTNYLADEDVNTLYYYKLFSLNDSTLFLVASYFKESYSTAEKYYLKFYNIRTGANQLYYDTYIDRNENGYKDAADSALTDVMIELNNGTIDTRFVPQTRNAFVPAGTYTSRIVDYEQRYKYYEVQPAQHVSIFPSSTGGIDTVRFRLVPKPNIQDLQVSIIPLNPARPGFESQYKIIAKNIGTKTIEQVEIVYKLDSLQTFISANISPDYVVDDTITWTIDSLTIYESREFIVTFLNALPPLLNANDTLHLYAAIMPVENDSFPADNHYWLHQPVVNSYDPNDKLESHGGSISTSELNTRDYLYYTIRFQNTGNASAVNVIVRDTLSPTLDWSTFEMLSSSHTYKLNVKEQRYITWTFKDIYLPDSASDEQYSHGYIHFRIKPAEGLTPEDVITNRAAIYFDFNPPIFTNTHTTLIIQPRVTSVASNHLKTVRVFPNPVTEQLTIDATVLQSGVYSIQLLDVSGKVISNQSVNWNIDKQQSSMSLQNIPNGIYLLTINYEGKSFFTTKILKQ